MILLLCLGLLQDTTLSDTLDIVRYRANSIIYDLENSVIILRDSAIITYKDVKLTSDSARYYVDTKHLEAFGACDLRQLSDSIKGDFLRYNIENKKALMNLGKTQIDKGFLEGQDIYWIDEKTVNCYRGKYTTCNDSQPHYYFYSPKMKVYLGDMVIARPLYLYIEGLPVLAAPFWFVPISSRRKSGLLPFRIGNSSTFGKYVRDFAYYLVLSDYADVTIQVDAMEKKGIMPQIEGIWDYRPYAKGIVLGSYIRDTETQKTRYSIEARNSSEAFLLGSSLNFDIKYVSDNSYRQDYAETTAIWLEKEITSSATLTRTFAGYKNNLSFERRQDFTDTTISLKLPAYTLSGPSSMLFRTINYSLSGHLNRDRYTTPRDTTEAIGANLHTTPTIQQNVFNLFSLSPKLDLDLALFDKDTAGNHWPTRFGYSFAASASTNLFRVFNTNLLGIHGILHKIMPSVTYTYTPAFDFTKFPKVTGIPTYLNTNGIAITLNQELEAKVGADLKKVNLLRFNVNGSYNFLNDSLSSISFLIAAPYNPFPAWVTAFNTQVEGSINPYTRDYDYTITNTSGIKSDFFSITVSQSYQRQGSYQIWFNGDIKPTPNWHLTYSARYDWQSKDLVDYSFGLVRNLHCWEAIINFNQLGDAWRYDFKIRIKAIPEVSIGKGLLGYIFE